MERVVCRAVAVPALPVIFVWSPVLVPEMEASPVKVRVRVASPVTMFKVLPAERVSFGLMVSALEEAPFTTRPVWFRRTEVMSVLAPLAAEPETSELVKVGVAINPKLERAVRASPVG